MLFSSIPFLYYFLPTVLILYALTPKKLKNTTLLLASLFFYGWSEPRYVVLMLVTVFQGYVLGLLMERYRGTARAKVCLVISLVFSLGMLGCFKYADFFVSSINAVTGLSIPLLRLALPVGISFYTFQILSYAIDVYRGEKAQRNFITLACYIALFPQLIAGPIVRYTDIKDQMENRRYPPEQLWAGSKRFLLGLGKKILIANALGELCEVFRASGDQSLLFYWLYAIAFTLHIYFDFSGYSDMAIGLGALFGFHFPENFRYPYCSASITEFWRRWHISLGSWFRDYVYIPLGGSRCAPWKHIRNILIVWLLTGFWHGAAWNFVLWGLYFGLLLILEKKVLLPRLERRRWLGHIYALFFVVIGFVIFNAGSMAQVGQDLLCLFGFGKLPVFSAEFSYYLRSYAVILILAVIGATPLPARCVAAIRKQAWGEKTLAVLEPIAMILLLLGVTAYLVDGSFNPFLYFRF